MEYLGLVVTVPSDLQFLNSNRNVLIIPYRSKLMEKASGQQVHHGSSNLKHT